VAQRSLGQNSNHDESENNRKSVIEEEDQSLKLALRQPWV